MLQNREIKFQSAKRQINKTQTDNSFDEIKMLSFKVLFTQKKFCKTQLFWKREKTCMIKRVSFYRQPAVKN
jgi:hypothetical protein